MKIKYISVLIIISVVVASILYYNKCNLTKKQLLTKNAIFDIIEEVEDIVISCITKSGNKSLSEENKLDFIIRYIIDNRQRYSSNIIKEESNSYYNKEENILYGKIKEDYFKEILDEFFVYNYSIKEYKFYKDGFIELKSEPCENINWDEKECIRIQEKGNVYYIYIKYIRKLNDIKNEFYVEYIFNVSDKIKIENVTIYNSIIS